ncbi:sulfur carrier protein ThiS [Salinibacillus xinjiangensis]|uniref:Thiamine biosynthesis protein ThiS n=1 Tax=Salinibacillus xinjiangensis TaxID=1229268 RepID=A0A6G1X5H0_9BACI|nr:sulfur carrier protein ThiS [Salinibacillus xinjiangensis]MRG86155.1 thiamine biosynthesis protein ThiS [Salinibacillus xinjiangensis]
MRFFINGDQVEVPASVQTVGSLLEHFDIDNKVVIVEHNGNILSKDTQTEQKLEDGDRLELVHFVGGG